MLLLNRSGVSSCCAVEASPILVWVVRVCRERFSCTFDRLWPPLDILSTRLLLHSLGFLLRTHSRLVTFGGGLNDEQLIFF